VHSLAKPAENPNQIQFEVPAPDWRIRNPPAAKLSALGLELQGFALHAREEEPSNVFPDASGRP
jgi:hypothetical protein